MISSRLFDHLSSGNLVIVTWWADCEWKHLAKLSGSNLGALRWIVSHDRSLMMMMFSIRIFFRRNSITTKMFRTTSQEEKIKCSCLAHISTSLELFKKGSRWCRIGLVVFVITDLIGLRSTAGQGRIAHGSVSRTCGRLTNDVFTGWVITGRTLPHKATSRAFISRFYTSWAALESLIGIRSTGWSLDCTAITGA